MEEKRTKDIEMLRKMIKEARNVVFFGGAGVSTESGIPDFRGAGGLYTEDGKGNEYYLSRRCLTVDPFAFYRFFREHMTFPDARPNAAHKALAKLEEEGKLKAIITQNIDGLHQKAGSKKVFELHGSTLRNFCTKCGEFYDEQFILQSENAPDKLPHCTKCGGIVKPDVVLYEEDLDDAIINGAIDAISNADTLIIGGTSLIVYPAAGLINYFRGENRVLINKSQTSCDHKATLVIHQPIGQVLGQIKVE